MNDAPPPRGDAGGQPPPRGGAGEPPAPRGDAGEPPPPRGSRPAALGGIPGGTFSPRVLLAIVAVAVLGYITLNSLRSDAPSSRGLAAGAALPPFAAPLSTSTCRGRCDANVATRAGQGDAGASPACEVRGPGILNSCELAARGPLVLAFVFTPVADCRAELSVLDGVRSRNPDVAFAAIAVRAGAPAARDLARDVTLPVAFDHDGAVANEYGVVVCPTITYVRQGGRVAGSTVGPQGAAAIEQWLARIR